VTARASSGVRRTLTAFVLFSAALAGCKTPAPQVETEVKPHEGPAQPAVVEKKCDIPPPQEVRSEIDEVMNFYAGLRSKPANALKQELEDAKRDYAAAGSEASRLKLALLYLHPAAPFRNEASAAQLLEPYARNEGRSKGPWRGLAQMLLASIEQSRRNDAAVQAQVAKVREEQKKSDELQRKLDALKDVERAMIQKDQGGKPK